MSTLPPLDDAAVEPESPGRLRPGEPVGVLWMITLVTFGVWLVSSSLYALVKILNSGNATPTTQISFSSTETVGLGLAIALLMVVILIGANVLIRPGGLARLGLDPTRIVGGVIAGVACSLVIVPLTFGAAYLTQWLWQLISYEHPNAHPLLRVFGEEGGVILRALVAFTAAVLAPVYEELLFRGHLQTAVLYSIDRKKGRHGRLGAIVTASLVFMVFHAELWMMPPIFFLSICLGLVYEWTSNLWSCMTVHCAFNTFSLAYYLWFLPRH